MPQLWDITPFLNNNFVTSGYLQQSHGTITVVYGVTYSRYSATVHVFDGMLMICLWYGEGRVGWGGVGG